ncbi:MAG: CoA transferase [Acidimicrobiia bacterium]|nr:CoA transferase [Acidimicrobiia bacterium]
MLQGIRVLDLTQYLSGPSAARLLAAMGADVIKVELGPGGDPSRALPLVKDGRSAYYVQQNRGKRSVCVDFGRPEGHEVVRELAQRCDVVVENFGVGVLERRGLDYKALSEGHPGLIMASISAFGRTGPLADLPGYDLMGQAVSGMMHVTGEPEGAPLFTGSPIADCSSGVLLFAAVGHALFHRERTGRGQYIDVSMVDSLFHMHSIAVQAHSVSGGEYRQVRTGRQFDRVVPSGAYRSPQGWVVIQALDRQWPRLCDAMDRPDLVDDPAWASADARAEHPDDMTALLESWMATFPDDAAVLARLAEHRIPAAPVLDPADAAAHPYFRERQMVREVPDEVLGQVSVPGFPIKFSERDEPDVEPPAPFLGQHNAEVLREVLGWDQDRVDALHSAGVLFADRV